MRVGSYRKKPTSWICYQFNHFIDRLAQLMDRWRRSKLVLIFAKILGVIFPLKNKTRLGYFFISIAIGHLVVYLAAKDVLVSWLYHDDYLNITDMEDFKTKLPIFQDYLYRSYVPYSIFNSLYPNETNSDSKSLSMSQHLYENLNQEHDPRLIVSLWLNSLYQSLTHNNKLNSQFSLPFSWASILDLKSNFRVQYSSDMSNLDCIQFLGFAQIPLVNYTSHCQSLKSSPSGYPKVKFTGPLNYYTSIEAYKLASASYLLHSAPIPDRLCLLGVGPNGNAVNIPTYRARHDNSYNKYDLKSLIYDYLLTVPNESSHEFLYNGMNIQDQVQFLKEFWSTTDIESSYIPDRLIDGDVTRIIGNTMGHSTTLQKSDFQFDAEDFVNELKNKVSKSIEILTPNSLDHRLLRSIYPFDSNSEPPKYFHEASILGTSRGAHFDWRFFQKIDYSHYETQAILHRISRAWLRFAYNVGLNTWLAHGSLLGWYWNGLNMPWDQDLDVQITMESLITLARNYNQTLVVDLTSTNRENLGIGKYLIDVGSSIHLREKGNGENIIDARFIDIETGFYVDITAIAFTRSVEKLSVKHKSSNELNQLLDPEFTNKENSNTIVKEDLYSDLYKLLTLMYKDENIFNCKNDHFYNLQDLNPLIPTLYEGVIAYVPNRYKEILKREYRKSLLNYEYGGHTFRPMLDIWVPNKICSKDRIGDRCFDKEVLLETKYTRAITSMHRKEMDTRYRSPITYTQQDEHEPLRVDPWIIKRSEKVEKFIKSSIY